MGHGITRQDRMAYVGEMPWHGLGKKVANAMTSREALIEGGINWSVLERPIGIKEGNGYVGTKEFKALLRSDTGKLLHVARSTYTPLQNWEALEFSDDIVGGGEAKYVTVGSLHGGRKVWMLAELTKCNVIVAGDEIKPYFLLHNAHDGTSMVRGILTPVRVVCANTLSMALGSANREGFALRHTKGIRDNAASARKALGLILKGYDQAQEKFNFLAEKSFTEKALSSYVEEMLPVNVSAGDRAIDNAKERRKVAVRLALHGKGNDRVGVRGTWWAAYNGMTELIDHAGGWRSKENRMKDLIFGGRATAKVNALDLALEYADGKK